MSTDGEERSDVESASDRDSEFGTPVSFVTDRKPELKTRVQKEMEALKAELEAKAEEIQKLKLQLLQVGTGANSGANANIDRRPDFRELKELVSKFNPKDPTCLSAQEWIDEINTTATHYKWKDETKLHCARLNLEGSAKLWWAGVQNEATTWAIFSRKLVTAYPSARDPIFYHAQMTQRRKLKEETLDEYVYTQVAMGKRAGFEESVIVKYVINGLGDFTANSKVTLGGKIDKVETLMEQLKWMEGLMDASSERDGVKTSEKKKEKINVCYRCNKPGHKAVACKMAGDRSCFSCGDSGHLAKNCPKQLRAGPSRVQMVDEENNFIKMVGIGGMRLNALIDSGCKVSTIQWRFAGNAGRLEETNTTLVGFGGKKVKVDKMVRATVKLDEIEVPVKLNVVPNWTQSTALILGRDLLNQEGVVMMNKGGDVKFQYDGGVRSSAGRSQSQMVVEVQKRQFESMYTIDDRTEFEEISESDLNAAGPKEDILKLVNEFRPCFAKNMKELGVARDTEMKIELCDKDPVYVKPHRMEYARETVLREIVEELVDANIVVESVSPYSSRVVMVPKKDGSFRMAVDYRLLNKKTVKDRYPMPDIEWCLNKLSGAELFITIDLYSGYYQIPVAEESQACTAFSTRDGHYHFLRMPFGLVNGCSVFQRAMNNLTSKLRKEGIVAYIDDLVIGGKSVAELLRKFRRLLEVLKESGFTINLKKSHFFKPTIEFLGFEVSKSGVRPGSAKTSAVEEFPVPETVQQVQQFLGLAGFFRRFVPRFSLVASPLFALLKKEAKFVWEQEQEEAFSALKKVLSSRPLLVLFDPLRELELHTDASKEGLAGILLMQMDDGLLPVSYFSKKTTEAERNYHSYELEVLAVVTSVERFRHYLIGKFFTLRTDCSAVRDTYEKREMNARIARWFLKLQEYDFKMEHRAGTSMRHVDALSRNPVEPGSETLPVLADMLPIDVSNEDFLVTLQRQDPKLVQVIDTLGRDPITDEDRQVKQNYQLVQNRLMRIVDGDKKWVVPNRVRWRLMNTYHDGMGHFGEEKVLEFLRSKFWFPKMRKYVRSYVQACPQCAYYKSKGSKPEGFLHPVPKDPVPFSTVHLDHMGPFIRSARGNSYVLLLTCGFSKFVVARAVQSTKTGPVLKVMTEVTGVFGTPSRIVTDRGTAFTSKQFEEYCRVNQVRHIKTAVGSPRANGQVERSNKTVLNALRCTVGEKNSRWDERLAEIQWSINSMTNSTTKLAPNSLVFTFKPRDVHQNAIVMALHDEDDNVVKNSEELMQRAMAGIKHGQQIQKQYFDEKRREPTEYQVGDMVLVERDLTAMGHKVHRGKCTNGNANDAPTSTLLENFKLIHTCKS